MGCEVLTSGVCFAVMFHQMIRGCHVKEWYAWCTASKVFAVFNLIRWCCLALMVDVTLLCFLSDFLFCFSKALMWFLSCKGCCIELSMKPIILSIIHIWSLLQVNQESSQNYEKQSEHLGSRSWSSGPIWYCLINREHIEIQTVESF